MSALVCACFAGAAAWLSFATVGFDAPAGSRIALLPVSLAPALAAGVVAVGVFLIAARLNATAYVARVVSPLLLLLLPWLPFPLPAALLLCSGAVTLLVWIAVAAGLVAIVVRHRGIATLSSPRVDLRTCVVLSAVVFLASAWSVSPSTPTGDEPHYLVIAQSLLHDHDLRIENNYRQGDYRAYFAADLRPDGGRRGRNGELYSVHAPGLPMLVLPAFAAGGYRGVVLFLIACATAASGLAWWLAWRVSGSRSAAWFGWAAVTLSPPFLLESVSVNPDGVGAALVLTGIWALLRADWEREDETSGVVPWLLHGVALALLPWLHTRFVVLAATIGGLVLVRLAKGANPLGKAIAFLSAPAVSALAWLFFFVVVYGAPDPSAPYGGRVDSSFAFLLDGAGGLLLDQGAGLLPVAPVLAFVLVGWIYARRLALDWLVIAAPYFLAVATFGVWWAGMAGPARFLVPLLLPLAIPAACVWRRARGTGTRALLLIALLVTCWVTAIAVCGERGALAYHARNDAGATPAPWFEWATHLVELPTALPAFVPPPAPVDSVAARTDAARRGFEASAVWLACLGAAVWLLRRTSGIRPAYLVIPRVAVVLGIAAMLAAAIVWSFHFSVPTGMASQIDLLRGAAHGRVVGVDLTARRRISPADLPRRIQLVAPVARTIGQGLDRRTPRLLFRDLNRPLTLFPGLPAGEYRLRVRRRSSRDGWVMVGVAPDQFSIVTEPIGASDEEVAVSLPVDVRSLAIRADEGLRDQVDAVELQPLRIVSAAEKVSAEVARRAIRYGDTNVFFLDDRARGDPAGVSIAGRNEARMVLAPSPGAVTLRLLIRNEEVLNHVTVTVGQVRHEWDLQPREARTVEIPIEGPARAALVSVRSATAGDHGGLYLRLLP